MKQASGEPVGKYFFESPSLVSGEKNVSLTGVYRTINLATVQMTVLLGSTYMSYMVGINILFGCVHGSLTGVNVLLGSTFTSNEGVHTCTDLTHWDVLVCLTVVYMHV